MDWAEAEERKELEELRRQQEAEANGEIGEFDTNQGHQPTDEEKEWMQKHLDEQMKKMKELHGDDLYEDITIEGDDGE